MGADFIMGVAEMPPVPTLGGRGLNHDDEAKNAIAGRLRSVIENDRDLASVLIEDHYPSIMDEIFAESGKDWDWDEAEMVRDATERVADLMVTDLRNWWNGSWGRNYDFLDTFDKDGNPVRLCISGEMSWGDVPEVVEVFWRFSRLPSKWWEAN